MSESGAWTAKFFGGPVDGRKERLDTEMPDKVRLQIPCVNPRCPQGYHPEFYLLAEQVKGGAVYAHEPMLAVYQEHFMSR